MYKIKNTGLLLYGVLFLLGCACSCNDKKDETNKKIVSVKTVEIGAVSKLASRDYVGVVEEESAAALSFAVSGNVSQVYVGEGQKVSKGMLLAQVSTENLQSSYDVAQSSLKQAEDAMTRMQMLYDNQSLPEIKYIEAKTKLEQAKSLQRIAAKNLADSKLYAPFDGIIGKRTIDIGENAIPGKPVFTLLKINTVKIKFSVPENEIAEIDKHGEAKVFVAAVGNKQFSGAVTEKNIVANDIAHTYDARIKLENRSGELIPGMVCRVMISKENNSTIFVLPNNTVMPTNSGKYFVWLVKDGKATSANVTIGELTDTGIIITDGLQNGDKVIVEGYHKVSEGMKVQEL
ncbi:MAG: efflux RND transporter periplasmic adaptor subunit [Prevotellaceae bacterium]|jgi:RND family efflux transporter MFP subunit|nr:efflux RND transporter periplasmic adaptor subunit [Prevotellaceae bacterium]